MNGISTFFLRVDSEHRQLSLYTLHTMAVEEWCHLQVEGQPAEINFMNRKPENLKLDKLCSDFEFVLCLVSKGSTIFNYTSFA